MALDVGAAKTHDIYTNCKLRSFTTVHAEFTRAFDIYTGSSSRSMVCPAHTRHHVRREPGIHVVDKKVIETPKSRDLAVARGSNWRRRLSSLGVTTTTEHDGKTSIFKGWTWGLGAMTRVPSPTGNGSQRRGPHLGITAPFAVCIQRPSFLEAHPFPVPSHCRVMVFVLSRSKPSRSLSAVDPRPRSLSPAPTTIEPIIGAESPYSSVYASSSLAHTP